MGDFVRHIKTSSSMVHKILTETVFDNIFANYTPDFNNLPYINWNFPNAYKSIQKCLFCIKINLTNKCYWLCVGEHIGNSNSLVRDVGDKSQLDRNLIKKLFPSEYHEFWGYHVRIKWLKGYWILSTNMEMRASESWDSKHGTPCRFPSNIRYLSNSGFKSNADV